MAALTARSGRAPYLLSYLQNEWLRGEVTIDIRWVLSPGIVPAINKQHVTCVCVCVLACLCVQRTVFKIVGRTDSYLFNIYSTPG